MCLWMFVLACLCLFAFGCYGFHHYCLFTVFLYVWSSACACVGLHFACPCVLFNLETSRDREGSRPKRTNNKQCGAEVDVVVEVWNSGMSGWGVNEKSIRGNRRSELKRAVGACCFRHHWDNDINADSLKMCKNYWVQVFSSTFVATLSSFFCTWCVHP